ncbi:hypothetical protein NM688_g2572 [Phlebia brevispora]|uniref:Uncharacterized protein n=1 Tax=Phlebia brevispora TaxID=194682 RepID=A0ACC1T874_9APHY|nr:hypothetical protein NM688_g2572 [Phlebia brevispora]
MSFGFVPEKSLPGLFSIMEQGRQARHFGGFSTQNCEKQYAPMTTSLYSNCFVSDAAREIREARQLKRKDRDKNVGHTPQPGVFSASSLPEEQRVYGNSMSDTYPIVGIKDGLGPNGARPLRYEINKFVDPKYNPYAQDQLNLFLLALEKIQAMSRSERLSWFQIGGIHGEPYVDWDSSKGIGSEGDRWEGYCTHASILFPTWHRLYVALIEQAVHECMKQVLAEFPQDKQGALKLAVDHWRYPYWDWALVKPGTTELVVPELMRLEKIDVQRPNGVKQTIDNPMYRYRFPLNSKGEIDGFTSERYSTAPFTVRHPTSETAWTQGISDNDAVQKSLNDHWEDGGRQLVVDVYQLFMQIRSYPVFSNAGWRPSSAYASLENVHNTVHAFIGGRGHMSGINFAGFDPAFWMHHGNVERLFSIFQALNPADYKDWPEDRWLSAKGIVSWFDHDPENDDDGTWTSSRDTEENTHSPLTPFHKDTKGTVYDSDGCRYISDFGYAFEELQDWLPKYRDEFGMFDTSLYCKDIRKALREKYGWSAPAADRIRHLGRAAKEAEDLEQLEGATTVHHHRYNEYVVNVLVDRFANDGMTFLVNLFLGEVPDDSSSWETANKLGSVAIFGGTQYATGNCANCANQASSQERRLVTGQITITTTLLDLIEAKEEVHGEVLGSLHKNEVARFLKKNLHWRIVKIGNAELPLSEVPSLKISVAVATATLPTEEGEFIEYGDFEVIDEPTVGRTGGYDSRTDQI